MKWSLLCPKKLFLKFESTFRVRFTVKSYDRYFYLVEGDARDILELSKRISEHYLNVYITIPDYPTLSRS